MPDISREIDRLASIIADKTKLAIEEVVSALIELTQDKTIEVALELLSGMNLRNIMLSKTSNILNTYEQGAILLLDNMYTTSLLTESTLRILLDNSKRLLASELIDKLGDNILQKTFMGITQKLTPTQILSTIDKVTPDIETQVITAYGQYSSAVTTFLSENLPDNTKYVYIGAYDSKTRLRCEDKINFSPATRKQIIVKYGDMNNEVWNCRHRWEQISSKPKDQGFNKDKYIDA